MMTTASGMNQWLIFMGALLVVGVGLAFFIAWLFVLRKTGNPKRKRRKKHHERRRQNPTLAETGGLPPVRKPGEPPKGV